MTRLTRREFALSQLSQAPLEYDVKVPQKRAPYKHPEADLQKQCVKHYRDRRRVDPLLRAWTRLFAINPLQQKLTRWQQAHCKAMGLIAGPHDLQFLDIRTKALIYHWIEMKSERGTYTQEQQDFADFLAATPVRVHVVRSLDEFIKVIA